MTKTCESCGQPFEAARRTARFCGATCRKRASRAGGPAPRRERQEQSPAAPTATPATAASTDSDDLVSSLITELDACGERSTLVGQQAIAIARRIVSPVETGASVATLSRELRALMAQVRRKGETADVVDEVTERRDAKLRAAASAG
ncbi:hypothetical protein SEA_EYRE_1 [Gordonia phage Eyre]|uniref:Terminase small subunit n=1 Tax=Gordonia phage Eyre TaxID=1887646 RepID=A0A1B3AZX1_9CAUD|nr:hypothetical protein BIZ73_gp01 [Gordonia phage Eyre]AOE44281.1 hypothetical protein SEA_EYRE_1 [Gordonia phage Eyre]